MHIILFKLVSKEKNKQAFKVQLLYNTHTYVLYMYC